MALKKISDHFLVPKHEIVPKERVDEILKTFGTDVDRLPRILITDPAIEEIKAKREDIIKITRKSPTAGKAIYFRIVV